MKDGGSTRKEERKEGGRERQREGEERKHDNYIFFLPSAPLVVFSGEWWGGRYISIRRGGGVVRGCRGSGDRAAVGLLPGPPGRQCRSTIKGPGVLWWGNEGLMGLRCFLRHCRTFSWAGDTFPQKNRLVSVKVHI